MSAHKLLLTICLELSDQCCQSTQRSISMVLNFKVRDFIALIFYCLYHLQIFLENHNVLVFVVNF